jgi:plasmid stabilization system protein ParE
MTRIEIAPDVLDDLERFLEHMARFEVERPTERLDEIVQSIDILGHSPLIGRPVKGGNRELIIGRGSRGYIALYRFLPDIDTVFVLALRSQREARFRREG